MNEHHEHTAHPDRAVRLALDDLAATMTDDSTILDGIYSKVGHLNRRRRTARVVLGTGLCTLALAGIAVLRTAPTTKVATASSTPSAATVPPTVPRAAP